MGMGTGAMFVGAQKKLPKKERGRKEKGEDYIIFTLLNHLIENHYKKWLKFSCILLQVTHELWFLNFTHGKLGCLLSFPLRSFLLHDAHAFGQLSLVTLPGHLSIKHFQHLFPFLDLFAGSNLTLLHHLQLHLACASFWMVLDEG